MIAILRIAVACFLSSLIVRAQTASEKEFTLTAHSELVLLDVSVKQPKGNYLSGLKKENFQVYENGKLQTITQFSSEDTPVTVGLVLDDSGSMRPKRTEVTNSALVFINSSNPHDQMFVTHFNDSVSRGLPPGTTFTDQPELLRRALWNSPAEGMTSLYDGILDGLHQLELSNQERKSLILISDGGDNASAHTFKDVLDAVHLAPAIIYTVGIFDIDDKDRNPGLLRRLAAISGGVAYLPQDLNELPSICRNIAKDIRNRYSIGYVPVRTDNKSSLRNIKVVVVGLDPQKLEIHARTSYLLPQR
jgi:Ca-activated chloride channel family protein